MARKFKAEVSELLDLMIHSLYSDREIFLRELISNGADALDKARFLGLTREDLAPVEGEPGVRVTVDAEAKTIVVEDDGIGLTEAEAVKNLGTIAHSGSKQFLAALQEGDASAPELIGQFGVGFYSAFMVADEVVVESKSALPDEPAIVWKSAGKGTFDIGPGDKATRGTRITLHLREDCEEFADTWRLQGIVKKYSDFLPWPVLVDGEQANTAKAIWQETPTTVTDEEANAFYKTLSNDWQDPAHRIHVKVDSPLQYAAMLFIPSERPYDLFMQHVDRGPRLYARRVLIMEHAGELLPDWLRFIRGVVDSEDVQLNVSREMLQKTPVVRKIREALIKRILKEFKSITRREAEEGEEHPYAKLWHNFGVLLKEGAYHEHGETRDKLVELLRFNAVSHDDERGLLSLAEYKEAMPEDQDTIWYLTAESRDSALASPHLEAFRKKGWDVLVLTHPVDEWLVQAVTEFDGVKLQSVSRGELELDDEVAADAADLTGLGPWLQGLFDDSVAEVRASGRLTDSACVLVDSEHGISGNMERILREAQQDAPKAQRVLELNPGHPLVKNLAQLHADGKTDAAEPIARLLLDDAMLLEGTVKDPAAIGRRLQALLQSASEAALR
ncbi:MAG: molecular chaperone HtpG [Deltaproteobacteria bacterium]|nr:MAG: molecular chaperone HtpG [Deltaproteobacteria bacterium]